MKRKEDLFMKGEKYRLIFVYLIFLSFISLAGAQSYGSSGTEEQLIEVFNQLLFTFEAESVSDIILFFLLPLFGFYFINKKILGTGFEAFDERVDIDGRTVIDEDETHRGLKGLAFIISFITVQITGIFGTVVLLLAGVLAFISWTSSYLDFLDWQREDDEDNLERAREEIERGEEHETEAEEDEEEGEIEDAEEEIEKALNLFKEVEGDLSYVLEYEISHIHTLLNSVEELMENYDDYDVKNKRLSPVKKRIKALEERLEDVNTWMDNDGTNGINDISHNNCKLTQNYFDLDPSIEELVETLKQQVSRNIIEGEMKKEEETRDELDQLIYHTNRLIVALEFMDRLNGDLEVLKKDEKHLEKLVKEAHRRDRGKEGIYQQVLNEEEQLKRLQQNLKKLSEPAQIQTLESQITEMVEELKEAGRLENSDIEDIKQRIKDLIREGSGATGFLPSLINKGENVYGDSFNRELNGGKSFKKRLVLSKDVLREIYSNLDSMQDNLNSNNEYISEEIMELEQKLEQLGIS